MVMSRMGQIPNMLSITCSGPFQSCFRESDSERQLSYHSSHLQQQGELNPKERMQYPVAGSSELWYAAATPG